MKRSNEKQEEGTQNQDLSRGRRIGASPNPLPDRNGFASVWLLPVMNYLLGQAQCHSCRIIVLLASSIAANFP